MEFYILSLWIWNRSLCYYAYIYYITKCLTEKKSAAYFWTKKATIICFVDPIGTVKPYSDFAVRQFQYSFVYSRCSIGTFASRLVVITSDQCDRWRFERRLPSPGQMLYKGHRISDPRFWRLKLVWTEFRTLNLLDM